MKANDDFVEDENLVPSYEGMRRLFTMENPVVVNITIPPDIGYSYSELFDHSLDLESDEDENEVVPPRNNADKHITI